MRNPVVRDAFRFRLYIGMRLTEVVALAWTQADMTVRIDDTKRGEPLEFPVTRQLAAILERRFADRERLAGKARGWVFPSETSASGHLKSIQRLNARTGGRREVLVPRPAQLLHHRRRSRAPPSGSRTGSTN